MPWPRWTVPPQGAANLAYTGSACSISSSDTRLSWRPEGARERHLPPEVPHRLPREDHGQGRTRLPCRGGGDHRAPRGALERAAGEEAAQQGRPVRLHHRHHRGPEPRATGRPLPGPERPPPGADGPMNPPVIKHLGLVEYIPT